MLLCVNLKPFKMSKFYTIIVVLLLFHFSSFSQEEIWGYNSLAGDKGGGLIFSIDLVENTINSIHRFDHGLTFDMPPSESKLFKGNNGLFYGTTARKSDYPHNSSHIFSYNPETNEVEYLIYVNEYARIAAINENKIFLYTPQVSNDYTEIYQYDILSNSMEKLFRIDAIDGKDFEGYWLKYNDSIYYASAKLGGENNEGSILKINIKNNTARPVIHFSGDRNPMGSLIKHNNQKIYGALYKTADLGPGGIFEFDADQESYQIAAYFNDETGVYTRGEMFYSQEDGHIYGVTLSKGEYNDGCIYKFNPDDNSIVPVYDIDNESDEFSNHAIFGGFIQFQNDHKLYGILEVSKYSSPAKGKIFCLDAETNNLEIIHQFDTNYSYPVGNLVLENDEFLGLVQSDYTFETGGIFSISKETLETSFKKSIYHNISEENGQNPIFMIQAKDQKIYGMTAYGGRDNKGVVFKIDNITYEYTKLMDLADFEHYFNPYSDGFEMEPGKIIGISGPQFWEFNSKNKDITQDCYIFEYDYIQNKIERKQTIYENSNSKIYGPRINSKGEMYFSLNSVLYEYNFFKNNLTQTTIDINDIGDILEYKENIYYGTMEGVSPDYHIIFKWDRNTNEIASMLSELDLYSIGNPEKIHPYGKIYISNDILYGSRYLGSTGLDNLSSYRYDINQDSIIIQGANIFGAFDNHLRRSFLETQDKKTKIENCVIPETWWPPGYQGYPTIFYLNIIRKGGSFPSLYIESSDVEYTYSLGGGWKSDPVFDFEIRVDLIEFEPPKDITFWTGKSDTNWFNDENWFLNVTPDKVNIVQIPPYCQNYPVITEYVKTKNLNIEEKAKLTLAASASLSCQSLTNKGDLNLEVDSISTASFISENEINNAGRITYYFNNTQNTKRLIASPIRTELNNDSSLLIFDGNNWQISSDSLISMIPFKPYLFELHSFASIAFEGNFNWGEQAISLENNSNQWSPLANPYAASFDWQQIDLFDIEKKALYSVHPIDSTIYSYIDGIGTRSPIIQPLDVFWLNAKSAKQFILTPDNQIHYNEYDLPESNKNELQIAVLDGETKNQTIISFNHQASNEFEKDKDAILPQFENYQKAQIFTFAGDQKLAINQLPGTAIMDMAVKAEKDGTYTIQKLKNKEFDFVVLEDLIWNIRINLLEEDYTFDYFVSDSDYPFKLYFEPWALEPVNETDIDMYYFLETLIIRSRKQVEYADVYIYDLAGKLSLDFKMENSFYFEKDINLPGGHYIAQFISGDLVINKKIFVR